MAAFLESEIGIVQPEDALFHIFPVPLEKSVSYGPGTSQGPEAILHASQHLELFDGYSIPAEQGIYTHPPLDCSGDVESVLMNLETQIAYSASERRIPVIFGGEHSISLAPVRCLQEIYGHIGVIQFDAHADLRYTSGNNKHSHACVMRRIWEQEAPFFQVGVRSLTQEEFIFRNENSIPYLDAMDIGNEGMPDEFIPGHFPEFVYVTIDVDILDSSVMPATGTPEPGGLFWYELMYALEVVAQSRRVVGFDIVELAPIEKMHAPDYTAARLAYNFMGIITRSFDAFKEAE